MENLRIPGNCRRYILQLPYYQERAVHVRNFLDILLPLKYPKNQKLK